MFEIRLKKRWLNPAFFQSESLAKVSFQARLLFQGLWCGAEQTKDNVLGLDGNTMGLIIDKPIILGSLLFPYDNKVNIDKHLNELNHIGSIVRYEAEGCRCIWIPRFRVLQPLHPNEKRTLIPPPSKEIQEKHAEQNSHIDQTESPAKLKPEIEPTDDIPYQEIIDDLNKRRKAKKPFTVTDGVKKLINGRWAEGFRLEDFIYVHSVKCDEWLGGKIEKFIRPITLYNANKFQSYINERSPKQIENTEKFIKEATCPKCENVGPIIYDLDDMAEAKRFTGKDPIYKAGTVSMTCGVDTCRHYWLIS